MMNQKKRRADQAARRFGKDCLTGRLCAAHVGLLGRADFKHVAFFNEERHLHDQAGFECGRLLHVAGGVALDAFRGFDDFHFD